MRDNFLEDDDGFEDQDEIWNLKKKNKRLAREKAEKKKLFEKTDEQILKDNAINFYKKFRHIFFPKGFTSVDVINQFKRIVAEGNIIESCKDGIKIKFVKVDHDENNKPILKIEYLDLF